MKTARFFQAALFTVGSISAHAAQDGREIYESTCIACHGDQGSGAIPGMPDLRGPDSVLDASDDVLIERILSGYQSPGSTFAMPARGGLPDLDPVGARAVLEYMRARFDP